MPTFEEIAEFVRKETAAREPLSETTSLQTDIGIYGDDLFDLMQAYSVRFGVNVESFVWYFHTGEENNFGGLFFKPPNARVQEIPITLGLLLESANAGHWMVSYPEHAPMPYRWDIVIGLVLPPVFFLLLIGCCMANKYIG